MFSLLVGPVEVAGDDLEDLEALDIAAIECEEVQQVVRDDLPGLGLAGCARGSGGK